MPPHMDVFQDTSTVDLPALVSVIAGVGEIVQRQGIWLVHGGPRFTLAPHTSPRAYQEGSLRAESGVIPEPLQLWPQTQKKFF